MNIVAKLIPEHIFFVGQLVSELPKNRPQTAARAGNLAWPLAWQIVVDVLPWNS